MGKVAFVGDVHLRLNAPRCRKDDPIEAVKKTLDFIIPHADKVVFLGDLFNSPHTPIPVVLWLFEYIMSHSDKEFYTIIGNHDISSYNEENLHKSVLSLFFASGILKRLPMSMSSCVFQEVPLFHFFHSGLFPVMVPERVNVFVGHYYFESSLDPNFSILTEHLPDNLDFLVLGHEHQFLGEKNVNGTKVIIPGSIYLDTSHDNNLIRPVCFYLFDCEVRKGKFIEIPQPPVHEVFAEQVFMKTEKPRVGTAALDFIALLKNYGTKQKRSIFSLLDDLESPLEVSSYLKSVFRKCGFK